jgi:SSS family solute:Na+ symporter
VQDVILPFRKKPFTPRQHLWLLRASIFGVAIFIFCFSMLFRQTQFIAMFCAITASVFVGGAGSVIIGGLYWKRGSSAGAWAAMLTGMTLSLGGLILEKLWPDVPLTGQEMSFVAIVCSVGIYVLVSLIGPRHVHNMDRLFHRGKYNIAGESATSLKDARTWLEKLGVDREFTGWDRFVTLISVGWPIVWIGVFVAGIIWHFSRTAGEGPPDAGVWLTFWHGFTWFIFASAAAVTVWFTIGGIKDLRYLFRTLRTRTADVTDDGRVAGSNEIGAPADGDEPEAGETALHEESSDA